MTRNKLDAYFTPPALTRVLIDRLEASSDWWRPNAEEEDGKPIRKRVIAEPCAGDNWIATQFRLRGYQVVTGDVDPDRPVHYPGCDIFSERALTHYAGCDAIVTNPPFSGAPQYVRRALEITDTVVMLLRISFLEPCEKDPRSARVDLLKDLSRVIVLPRVSFINGKRGTDSATCAWFIWDNGLGPTVINVVSEAELAEAAGQQKLFSTEVEP